MTATPFQPVPICPALVALTFDLLVERGNDMPLDPHGIVAIGRSLGADTQEAMALAARICACAIVFEDPRWPVWSRYFRNCDADAHHAMDIALLHIIATLPLTPEHRFTSDSFFDALINRTAVSNLC